MAKDSKRTRNGDANGDRGRRGPLIVVDDEGNRQPFLRGMLTHNLVLRGIDFDDAYATARAVRGQLAGREEITPAEISSLVREHLSRTLGVDLDGLPSGSPVEAPSLWIIGPERERPFSRGLLSQSLRAAGIDFDRAYELVGELEANLRAEHVKSLTRQEVLLRVGELLERSEGRKVARLYRAIQRVRSLRKPLVVYLGGASGTGKSTLTLELAPMLRIPRVNSTDTIRQVMRMLFSAQILPALHSSSFESAALIEPVESRGDADPVDDRERRIIATFDEQATRVVVGVRAIVERAIAENMSVLVEGVHLCPPHVPFPDLEGSCHQVLLMLATHDAEAHRTRFMQRARTSPRRAERYLESFGSIRVIHDHLANQAEIYDTPLLDHGHESAPASRAVGLIVSELRRSIPGLDRLEGLEGSPRIPTLLLIIDGLADRPIRALGGRTPLQAANTPNLDRLADEGCCGLADPVAPGVVPDTAGGLLALLGQSPLTMRRGPVEAIGAGIALEPGDIALRGNFATLDESGIIVDRRAGRIRKGARALARAINRLSLPRKVTGGGVEVITAPGTEHRLAVVLRGKALSSALHGSDPGEGAPPEPPLTPHAIDPGDAAAVRTAAILAAYEKRAREVLAKHAVNEERAANGLPPANAILTRDPGHRHDLLPLEREGQGLSMCCIAGDSTVLGLAAWLGAETISTSSMTANLDTDLEAKFLEARAALARNEIIIVHVKGADIAGHDRRPEEKMAFLERLDVALGQLLSSASGPLRIAIGADHATFSESGQHGADPVPVLTWGDGIPADSVAVFGETEVARGGLGRIPLSSLLSHVLDLSDSPA